MLTGHIQLMPLSQAPECLSSTFVLEITTLCNFMLHNQPLREGFIRWHWLLFFPPNTFLFTVLPWRRMKLRERSVVIWFCLVLITDCWAILPFFFSFCQILSLSARRQFHFSENNFTVVSQIKGPLLSIRGNHSRKTDDFTSSWS